MLIKDCSHVHILPKYDWPGPLTHFWLWSTGFDNSNNEFWHIDFAEFEGGKQEKWNFATERL